jgi:hypothetical protein
MLLVLKIEDDVMGGACGTYKGEGKIIQGLVGKPQCKTPPGRLELRRDDNIKVNLNEIVWEGVD